MKIRGSVTIIICCLMLQLSNIAQKRYLFTFGFEFSAIYLLCFQGLMFLVYPLLGHLAEVYLTRYRAMKCGLVILIMGEAILILCCVVYITTDSQYKLVVLLFGLSGAALTIIGTGLFEANAIQFGLDQLLEAPTQKLIAFIHWYYWSQNVGQLLIFYVFYGDQLAVSQIYNITKTLLVKQFSSAAISPVIVAITISALVLLCLTKKHFYIQRAGLNPFKNIYHVLKYSWNHKVPQRRSAFTYWEEDIPPRIDLGKNKYGGPFTNEEVEDTKTFLRILPLLLCLFGYHLAGDGYSAPEQFQRTSCPSLPVLLLITANPLHVSTLVTVVGIPLYRLVIIKIFPRIKNILMLTKMWMGLYLSLLQVVLYIILATNYNIKYWQEHSTAEPHIKDRYSSSRACLQIRGYLYNHTCSPTDDPVDNIYLWFIIPQLLNGLSSLLVSMAVFEFVCAQAPRTTQGLLIGMWYATFSIRYLVVALLDHFVTERRAWLICEGVKGFLILVSLVLFWCVSRHYRYRQRDEIVNVQGMIEDIYERRRDQEEEYMQERRAFYQNFRAYNATLSTLT